MSITGNIFKRHFVNWDTQARYQYRFSDRKAFEFDYQGKTVVPTIDQLQPVPIITDPLNITLGNPDLTPSFTNRFSVNYNSYKVLSGQSVYMYASYSRTSNPIVSNLVTNFKTGKSINQYFNLPGKDQSRNILLFFYRPQARKSRCVYRFRF